MNKQLQQDIEYLLTEWEGGSNPLVGAMRVKGRSEKLLALFTLYQSERDKKILEELKSFCGCGDCSVNEGKIVKAIRLIEGLDIPEKGEQ